MKVLPNQWIEKLGCSSLEIEVLLNGEVQKFCTEADDEVGYVIRWTGEQPAPNAKEMPMERVEGEVAFRRMARSTA